MRLKALAEIYTMHSFAQLLESIIENWGKKTWPKQPRKGENETPLSSTALQSHFFVKILPKTYLNFANSVKSLSLDKLDKKEISK